MASPLADADAVKSAVASISTCSAATIVTLKTLLLPGIEVSTSKPTKATAAAGKVPRRTKTANDGNKVELPAKEKAALATQVLNATLKALTEAAKPVPQTPSRKQCEDDTGKTTTQRTFRRSSSAPSSPLQPRSLNRVATSPVKLARARAISASSNVSVSCLPTVECARVAFSALKTLQASGKITLPELQLEAGMSSFVGKLVNLGLHDHAVKELRILKRRLEDAAGHDTKKQTKPTTAENKTTANALAELLDFASVEASNAVAMLVITTQVHVLRIMSAMKKPQLIEAALPVLRTSHHSSVVNHILSMSKTSKGDASKLARQMETVSQILLSLTPSVSTRDDNIATDSRLSVSPATAFELQALGLETRLLWWKLAGHQGDTDKDILSPLSRCLGAFIRRVQNKQSAHGLCKTSVEHISELLRSLSKLPTPPSASSKSPQASIYQALASLGRECGKLEDAVCWAEKLKGTTDPETESAPKLCSVSAQLLAFQLKRDPAKYLQDASLLNQVLAGVQGSLRGESSELDELLANVCSLRRAIIGILLGHVGDADLQQSTRGSLEAFVLQCPRFCVRWLGKPPTPTSSTKDYLRYEQRRQLLLQSIQHTLDSAFLLAKTLLDEKRLGWDALEAMLAESLMLLDFVGEIPSNPLYHVKISHFYYMKYNSFRQQKGSESAALKALRQSIDCMKDRPSQEREKAQLLVKLERMAELCKSLGRVDEALGALQGIRNSLVDDGVLKAIAQSLETVHPQVAWCSNHSADVLSRAVLSIARLEMVHMDWTVDLPEVQQAAALEHRLHFVLLGSDKRTHGLTLEEPTVDALLRIYIPTRFPIRRLRTLLRLLCATVGNGDLTSAIRSITADAVQLDEKALGEDEPLACYIPHLKTLFASVIGLIDGYPDLQALQQTLATWRCMVDAHPVREGLGGCIDGVEDLLVHLDSVADFLRLRGQQRLLDNVIHLSADISRAVDGPRPDMLVNSHMTLALHLTDSGLSTQAAHVFESVEEFLRKHEDTPGHVVAELQLALADHLLTIGDSGRAHDHLSKATVSFSASQSAPKLSRSRKKVLFAQAAYLQALIALQQGNSHHALAHCRESVRVLFQEWSRMASELLGSKDKNSMSGDETTVDMSMSTVQEDNTSAAVAGGPDFWVVFRQLFRALLQLSTIYAHLGMFQETVYYAEQADNMARNANSNFHIAQAATWMASVYLKANKPEKATELVNQGRGILQTDARSCSSLSLICQMGSIYRELQDFVAEKEMVEMAEIMLSSLKPEMSKAEVSETADLEKKMENLDIKEKSTVRVRATRRAVKVTATATARKATTTVARTKAKVKPLAPPPKITVVPEDPYLGTFRMAISIHKAVSLISRKDWAGAVALLRDTALFPRRSSGILCDNKQVVMAASLIGQGLEGMAHDSVFSVVHDSTLSFPTVAGTGGDKCATDRSLSAQHQSPQPRRSRAVVATRKDAARESAQQTFLTTLLEAQNTLIEAHTDVALTGDASLLHRVSAMLQTVTLVLSTIAAKGNAVNHIAHSASSADLARNLTWRRERKALLQEKHTLKADGNGWPVAISAPSEDSRRTSLGFSTDFAKFQRDYVEIIPKTWTALSISLSENKHDLCITRLQAGQSPFVIRLPLERASSRDADTEVFNFQQGRAELLDIIRLTNETCHDGRDMSIKGNKAAWWADREALDNRMKELLENIERDWLGGFRGIFSQHARRPDLLARFQKSFQNILDKHLPSRRQVRGRKGKAATATAAASSPKITLDPRILDLFVGLGDPTTEEDCDFDEALTDLLYFVVDILQFHGERNAYDEVDFDAMVVETLDTLHAYHLAAKTEAMAATSMHTILVLDKALHTFPWESLPCMRGQAVSRVPSLACLRRLILEQRAPFSSEKLDGSVPAGHYVPATSGTYILNPSRDLKSTQTTFARPLSTHLPAWSSVVARLPTETEFTAALTAPSSILLYFGHGSGAQYIRGKTIRRLDPGCKAVSLLWGCSSASLADCGEFECYGTVWNYLMAGCPAVTGTLWDVTDRDIDRFAGRTLEGWGVLPQGSVKVEDGKKKTGKGKGNERSRSVSNTRERPDSDGETKPSLSLVEAVACAREEACRFRYLTAAAVVVYGIPVYIDK